MSQSDSSTDSTVTVHPIQYVDVMSLANEEDEDEVKLTMADNPEAAVVLQDEIELMLQRVSQAIDCNNEVLAVLLQLHRSIKNGE